MVALFGIVWFANVNESEKQSAVAIAATKDGGPSYGGQNASSGSGNQTTGTSTSKTKRPSRRALRRMLARRITAFEQAILKGDEKGLREFFDPVIRNHPKLLFDLGRVVHAVEELGDDVVPEHTLSVDEEKADAFYFFREPESGRAIHLPMTRRLYRNEWYVEPQSDGSDTAPER